MNFPILGRILWKRERRIVGIIESTPSNWSLSLRERVVPAPAWFHLGTFRSTWYLRWLRFSNLFRDTKRTVLLGNWED